MSLPLFFIDHIDKSNTIILPEDTSKHCVQVLRMKEGEQLQLTDGKGNLLTAKIINADRKHCTVNVEEERFQQSPARKISIAISLLKMQAALNGSWKKQQR
jgi:16S rRNA (uracil1498-N3)-methyltransferase